MNVKAKILGAAMGALGLCGATGAAMASSITPPGERAGLDLASPLPEGVYFVDVGSVGNWRAAPGTSTFDYDVPIIAWATPWTILGGRVQLLAAAPAASLAGNLGGNTAMARGMYSPFVAGQLAWNLGNGFSVSYLAGAYIGVTGSNVTSNGNVLVASPFNETTFHQQLALAYHMNGWNATANLMYGIVGNNQTSQAWNPDYFNYDLALTKTFGKWEIGMVGYGSTDVGSRFGYADQSQFALGGLIGYNFGPVITQLILGSDIYDRNYATPETRLTVHVIIPLWNPEVPKAVAAKY